jgi:hypothetical protein
MKNFYEIVDFYINNYDILESKRHNFECIYGSIEFIKNDTNLNSIIIQEILVYEYYRRQGLCKNFIKYLVEKASDKKIIIQSVISKILYNFLLKFEYNDKKFILKKDGFCYS